MPALVTFHERLMAPEAIHASIDAALGIEGASYDGRRARAVQKQLEVSVQPALEVPPPARGGAHRVHEHRYMLVVFLRTLGAADRAGKSQQDAMATHLAALFEAFDCARPWQDVIGSDVLLTEAETVGIDLEPERTGGIEGHLLLKVFTNGTGSIDGTESPGG